jgi:hypothetical protein
MSLVRSIASVSLAVLSAISIGCGDGRATRVPVSGKVLIDGQPLTKGSVRFISPNSRASGGVLDSEGRFILSCYENGDGAVMGTHRIEVTANERVSSTKMRWFAPKKYGDMNLSGLQQKITGPTDSVVINLSWEGGKPFIEVDGVGGVDVAGDGGIR